MLAFVKRADQSTHYHMNKIVESLCDDGDAYTLVKTAGGYAIDWNGSERGSVVKCSNCGVVQDLWEGQPVVCVECLQ